MRLCSSSYLLRYALVAFGLLLPGSNASAAWAVSGETLGRWLVSFCDSGKPVSERLMISEIFSPVNFNSVPGDFVEPILRTLSDRNVEVRQTAALLLTKAIDPEHDLSALRSALRDPDVRIYAALAIAIASPDSTAKSLLPELIAALKVPSEFVRGRALARVERLGRDAVPALTSLLELLRDSDSGVRRNALRTLGSIGGFAPDRAPSIIPAVAPSLHDRELQVEAVRTLAQFPEHPSKVVPLIIELLRSSPSLDAREVAIDLLGEFGTSAAAAAPLLTAALDDNRQEQ